MAKKFKYTFVFIFLLSVCSLTLQASIINICKETKVFKSQPNPVSEEEENHDTDDEVDETIYLNHDAHITYSIVVKKMHWASPENRYISFTKSIPIPPPKF